MRWSEYNWHACLFHLEKRASATSAKQPAKRRAGIRKTTDKSGKFNCLDYNNESRCQRTVCRYSHVCAEEGSQAAHPQYQHGAKHPKRQCPSSPLSARIDRWRIELKGDVDEAFILEGLQNGFDLMDVDNMQDVRFAECNNNKSATGSDRKHIVDKMLEDALGHYRIVSKRPF